jgi:hypothetical protein
VQHKEALKGDTPVDTKGVSQQLTDARELPISSTYSPSGLLLAQTPASGINRMSTNSHVARAPASSMNGVVVSERGPEVATEEKSFKLNPYTEVLNRARVKSVHSPQNSISVPAYGMPDFEDRGKARTEPQVIGVPNPKKLLRNTASINSADTEHSERGWGRLISGSVLAVLVAGIGLATRKKVVSKESDIETGAPHETTPLLTEMPPQDPCHANDGFTVKALQSITEARGASLQTSSVSDPVLVGGTEGEGSIEEQTFNPSDQKEAADAKRKWMKMLRESHRARRQKRLGYLQRVRRMRLQRLKAARLHMKRKMQTDFGVANNPGWEKRISQDKDEENTPPRAFNGKDPRRVISLMMRLLRALLRARKNRRVRTT